MMVVEVVEVEGAGDEERLPDTTVLTTAEAAAEAAAMRVLKVADMMMAGGLKVVGVVESSPRWWWREKRGRGSRTIQVVRGSAFLAHSPECHLSRSYAIELG
jgi:hypothetical protein